MIKNEPREMAAKIEIDLCGEEGNAYVLLGKSQHLAKQLGLDVDAIMEDMQSADYSHLVKTMDKHFGSLITFYNAERAGVTND
jgi:hypothetical protein